MSGERQSLRGGGTQTGQAPQDSLPVGRGESLFPQPPGRGYDTYWLQGPAFLETQGGTCGFRDWSGCPASGPPLPWPRWGLSEVWGNRVTLVPEAGCPPRARPRACVPSSASLPAPSLAAAPTEVPGWLWFSPCFSNYVEWAKNSSSGPLFGSYHRDPGRPLLLLLPAARGPAPRGTCPVLLTSVPWPSSRPWGSPLLGARVTWAGDLRLVAPLPRGGQAVLGHHSLYPQPRPFQMRRGLAD